MNNRYIYNLNFKARKYYSKKSIGDLLFKNHYISLHPLSERIGWLKGWKRDIVPVREEGEKEEGKAGKNYLDFFGMDDISS